MPKVTVALLSLASRPSSAREARNWLAAELRSLRSDETRENALLVLSEVITNAIRHGGGGAIRITVSRLGRILRVQVRDGSAHHPIRHETGEAGGWGLHLIERLSDRWGVDQHSGTGKTVWFELDDAGVQDAR